jgi:hypothetical protein
VSEHLASAQAARTRVVEDLGATPDGRASARVSQQTAHRRFGSELSSVLGDRGLSAARP